MAIKYGKDLVIISLKSSEDFANKVDIILQEWKNSNKPYGAKPCKSFLQTGTCVRFGTGEGKGNSKLYQVLIEYQADDGTIYRARPATYCDKMYSHRLKKLKAKNCRQLY